MKKFTTALHSKMETELQIIATSSEESLKAKLSFEVIERIMQELKDFLRSYSFTSHEEEILFFKVIKPTFHRELIYQVEVIHIETSKPRGCNIETQIAFYQQIGEKIRQYFLKEQTLYLYYRTNRTSEDPVLFLRDNECTPMVPEDSIDMDGTFCTIASSKMAKIMAYEMILDYLDENIQQLERPAIATGMAENDLAWTDSKSDLIELAYALYSRGCINRGRAQVQQIITSLEMVFKAKTGNFYRTFQSMRLRKKNRTAFLDGLKESLIKKMDETDLLF